MTFMPWTDALSVGLHEIDDQHRWLVDATNRLHDALHDHHCDRASLGAIIEGLMDYTMNHFVMEESLFERHHYPDAAAHKAQHNHFTAKVMQLLTDFEAGQDLGPEVLTLLRDWLQGHIMHTDKDYAPYLAAQGMR